MEARHTAAFAGSLMVAVLALVAVAALSSAQPHDSPEPTASSACLPFRPAADPVAHTGPLPPQAAWNALATGGSNGARSLAEAAAISDLILVGRWIGSERFGTIGDPGEGSMGHYLVAVIRLERLVHGVLPPGCIDLVRVPFLLALGTPGSSFPEADFAALERDRPVEPALLFLKSWAGAWDRAGGDLPAWVAPLDRYDIYRTIGLDGALPLVGDRVSDIVFENDMPPWRLEAAGASLEEFLGAVAEAAPIGPGTTP